MPEGHGFRARAHHLVGVAAARWRSPQIVAPRATRDTAASAPRASRRSLAGVDAPARRRDAFSSIGNRRPGLYTPDASGYAWIQNFNNGNQNNNNKSAECRVRAVRK